MWKGDRVRLLVGKDEDKFVDAAIGAASGYKIYTIAAVDQKRNKVYLEGVLVSLNHGATGNYEADVIGSGVQSGRVETGKL